jgi:hypothetical protein
MTTTVRITTPDDAIICRAELDASGHGPCYTAAEWDADAQADWELTEDGLLFQGAVVDGSSYELAD